VKKCLKKYVNCIYQERIVVPGRINNSMIDSVESLYVFLTNYGKNEMNYNSRRCRSPGEKKQGLWEYGVKNLE
jgi:hypothetical protein